MGGPQQEFDEHGPPDSLLLLHHCKLPLWMRLTFFLNIIVGVGLANMTRPPLQKYSPTPRFLAHLNFVQKEGSLQRCFVFLFIFIFFKIEWEDYQPSRDCCHERNESSKLKRKDLIVLRCLVNISTLMFSVGGSRFIVKNGNVWEARTYKGAHHDIRE